MALPNFIIAGASKSGTTSLFHYLAQHPDICMSRSKEPKFFIDCEREVRTMADYEALFSHCGSQKAMGEATPAYLYDRRAPVRIKDTLGNIRIIIMLRNPADMAFALWRHVSRFGRRGEHLPFAEALAEEPRRMSDPAFRGRRDTWPGHFYYFSRVQYYEQVKRYMETFGEDMVRVYLFDDFKADPLSICRDVFRFLGVDDSFAPVLTAHNVGREVRHRGLEKLISSPPRYLRAMGGVLPSGVTERVKSALRSINSKQPPRLDDRLRSEILERSRKDIDNLGRLIGRDLSFWYRHA